MKWEKNFSGSKTVMLRLVADSGHLMGYVLDSMTSRLASLPACLLACCLHASIFSPMLAVHVTSYHNGKSDFIYCPVTGDLVP